MDESISQSARAAGVAAAPSLLIVFFGALAALGPLSVDAYLPAFPQIARDFGVSIVSVQNTLSAFLIGYALGQFFGGSFSDQIGRKRIGYIGLGGDIWARVGNAVAGHGHHMLVLRFFSAVGGGLSPVGFLRSGGRG